jgi:hypothetical protein
MKQLSFIALLIILTFNLVKGQVNTRNIYSADNSGLKIKSIKFADIDKRPEGSKVLVISKSELYNEIQFYIDRYIVELIGENYDPELVLFETGNHEDLRQFIYGKYLEGFEGCIMIGDLPIAYYHTTDCNTHQPSDEVFPCDLFYMDLDGEFIDSDNDGDYDEHIGNVTPEIWFGRLFASNLTYGSFTERELMIRYFEKNHLYRSELNHLPERAMVYVDDDFHLHDDFYDAVSLAYDSIILHNQDSITSEQHYKEIIQNPTELMQVCVHGLPNAHTFIQPSGSYSNLYSNELRMSNPISHFAILYGCSNAKYTVSNCLANWYTFHKDYIVASLGSGKSGSQLFYSNFYTPFGNGSTIGEAFLEWFVIQTSDGFEHWERCCFGGLTLLGDPTLKMQKFQSTNWINILPEESDTAFAGEPFSKEIETDVPLTNDCVFEIVSGRLPFGLQLVANEIVGTPLITDTGVFVFTIKLYSQANSDEFDIQHFTIVNIDKNLSIDSNHKSNYTNIYPSPANNKIVIDFSKETEQYNHLEIINLNGILIYSHALNSKKVTINLKEMNIGNGIYLIRLSGENRVYTTKIIVTQ